MLNENLPILDIINDIKSQLASANTLILQAPPGAGKSTLLPIKLLNESWLDNKKIILLEPRRLAAKTVAIRMAALLNEEIGETVGYRVRFENKTSPKTKIEVVTEGILTKILQNDNSLEDVGMVIFDEFHERSLASDLALALCRDVQQIIREDLRILIMSATLDGEKLSNLLTKAPIITSAGRQYPIKIQYAPFEAQSPLSIQLVKLISKAFTSEDGDILVFLPGVNEIQKTQELLIQEIPQAKVFPLYGDLSPQKQQEAILPDKTGKRKIVLSTTIAETSLTIEGIRIVIDSGLTRVPKFDPKSGLTKLETVKVTKDAADQRAGRAGRQGPGTCYRLWSEGSHIHLIPNRIAEITEADLAPMMLELYGWGFKNINSLTWMTPPPSGAVSQASQLLEELGAIKNSKITERGKEMLTLPTHPRIAHLLIEGKDNHQLDIATDLAALLEEKDPLKRESGANLALRIKELRNWRNKGSYNGEKNTFERIERLALSWRTIFKTKVNNESIREDEIGKLLSYAYPEQIAKQRDNGTSYKLSNGRIAKLSDQDPLVVEKWLAITHLDAGLNEGRIFLAAPINPNDILSIAKEKRNISWDKSKGIIIARNEVCIGDLVISSTTINNFDEDEKNKILCNVINEEGLQLLHWTDKAIEYQNRIASLKLWRPEEQWPDISNTNLLHTIEDWLPPFLNGVRRREDFAKLNMEEILTTLLPWELQSKVELLAPEKIKVPSGSEIKIKYSKDGDTPILAVRLQELFGLSETPIINDARTKLVIHLLSPAFRPVQVTQDLKSFWHNTYPEVRKELKIRYPKHSWPEDPWTAEAVRGIKRK